MWSNKVIKELVPCKSMGVCLAMLGMSSALSALTYKMLFLIPFVVDEFSFSTERKMKDRI